VLEQVALEVGEHVVAHAGVSVSHGDGDVAQIGLGCVAGSVAERGQRLDRHQRAPPSRIASTAWDTDFHAAVISDNAVAPVSVRR